MENGGRDTVRRVRVNEGGGDLSGEDRDHVFIEQKCLASAGLGTGRTR